MRNRGSTLVTGSKFTESPLKDIEVFHGHLSPVEARVYVRIPRLPGGQGWHLEGSLRGPELHVGRTLPQTIELEDLGAGPCLLGSARVVDPCYWSPELPALYRLQIRLCRGREIEWTTERLIGFSSFGCEGSNLQFQSRRFVFRGVWAAAFTDDELQSAQHAAASIVVTNPTMALCEQASREGILVVAHLVGDEALDRLRCLSHLPAVAMLILTGEIPAGKSLQDATENVLLAQHIAAEIRVDPAAWADVIFWEVDGAGGAMAAIGCGRPVVAVREAASSVTLSDARRQCDLLQRDLVADGDFSGYVIAMPG